MRLVESSDVNAAVSRLAGRIARTPVVASPVLSAEFGTDIVLKAENLQHTGSFKIRGALNALLARQERGQTPAGVVTFSAGNHGAAVASAGTELGFPVVVCMPVHSVPMKVAAVRGHGGEVLFTDDLRGTAESIAQERDYAVLFPFDDLDVIAGQATVGAELVEDVPSLELVVVPVGGGGLISGIAAAVRSAKPHARVVGVEPEVSNAMVRSLRAGEPAVVPRPDSFADGLNAPFAGIHTLPHVQALVDDVLEVSEEAIRQAWWELLNASKLLIEPSAAVGLAALRQGLATSRTTVLVLSGGNVDPAALATLA